MKARVRLLAAALLGAALLLAVGACGGSASSPSASSSSGSAAAGTQTKGGTLLVSYMGEPQYLDPAVDWEGNGWSIEHTMYNTLPTYASAPGTPGTVLVPDMATEVPTVANGGITDKGKTYTFHLRPGIKFAPPVNREVTAFDFK
jgi:peptide/nickel transport system substrate-binding protein